MPIHTTRLLLRAIAFATAAMIGSSAMAQQGADPLSTPLGQYYRDLEARLVGSGHLRQDRSGHGLNPEGLASSFMEVAMRSEYRMGGGGMVRSSQAMPLRRWEQPVRINVRFGPSVPAAQRSADFNMVRDVAHRLGRASGHSVAVTGQQANFHVLVLNDAEREGIGTMLRQLVPGISNNAVGAVRRMNRNTLCMVIAMPGADPSQGYVQAVAIVRAEHPPRMRRSCIEEEMAQGMGLPNDSDAAWPSIFNDDEEFGVLTRHDELLLRLLYDRNLVSGMSARQVATILPQLCARLVGHG